MEIDDFFRCMVDRNESLLERYNDELGLIYEYMYGDLDAGRIKKYPRAFSKSLVFYDEFNRRTAIGFPDIFIKVLDGDCEIESSLVNKIFCLLDAANDNK